jgi:hypothetical protein
MQNILKVPVGNRSKTYGKVPTNSVVDQWHFCPDPDPRTLASDKWIRIRLFRPWPSRRQQKTIFPSFSAHNFFKVQLYHFSMIKSCKEVINSRNLGFFLIIFQFCGSGSGIRCLFDPWIRDPGWLGSNPASGSGVRDEQPGSYLLELRNHFFGLNR